MKTIKTTAFLMAAMFVSSSLFAIDRDANMIDTAWLEGGFFDNSDYFGLHITGENLVKNSNGKWAILAGIEGGTVDVDQGEDFNSIGIELGVKYYIAPLTSIAGLGGYTWNDADDSFETGEITARIKQRLTQPEAAVSPYLKLETALQFVDIDDSDNIWVIRAMAGCDFRMSDTWALIFEGGYSESDNLDDGPDTEDGFLLRIGMQYDWE